MYQVKIKNVVYRLKPRSDGWVDITSSIKPIGRAVDMYAALQAIWKITGVPVYEDQLRPTLNMTDIAGQVN